MTEYKEIMECVHNELKEQLSSRLVYVHERDAMIIAKGIAHEIFELITKQG